MDLDDAPLLCAAPIRKRVAYNFQGDRAVGIHGIISELHRLPISVRGDRLRIDDIDREVAVGCEREQALGICAEGGASLSVCLIHDGDYPPGSDDLILDRFFLQFLRTGTTR